MQNKDRETIYSILLVSCSETFNTMFRQSLPEHFLVSLENCRNCTLARRKILERHYDIVVVNVPLQDENGLELAMDIAEKNSTGILVAAPAEIYEQVLDYVTESGVLAISKPVPKGRIWKAVWFLMTVQKKITDLEKTVDSVRERIEELRTVDKAKFLLMEKRHMTEEEAHRYVGKQAMNERISRRTAAQEIIDDFEII